MHQFARKASAAALVAHRQGKFWDYHQSLFANPSGINDVRIQEIAKEVHLNLEKFNKDMNDPAIQTVIDRDIKDGNRAEVRGTPSIFINGKMVKMRSLDDIGQMILAELKKKK